MMKVKPSHLTISQVEEEILIQAEKAGLKLKDIVVEPGYTGWEDLYFTAQRSYGGEYFSMSAWFPMWWIKHHTAWEKHPQVWGAPLDWWEDWSWVRDSGEETILAYFKEHSPY